MPVRNRLELLSAIVGMLHLAEADKLKGKKKPPVAKTETSGHGRIETRVAVVVEAKELAEYHEFPGLSRRSAASRRRE
jgi:hypothetical protein